MSLDSKKNLRSFFRALVLFMALSAQAHAGPLIDKGHAVFFSDEMGSALQSYKRFPVTWWNFLVFEMGDRGGGWAEAERVCDALKKSGDGLIVKAECRHELSSYLPLLKDWARDYPLRHDKPEEGEALSSMNRVLAKASLPMERPVLSHLRLDPFESGKELKALAEQSVPLDLPMENGFFFDRPSLRLVIPIQFGFPPDQDGETSRFYGILNDQCASTGSCGRWTLVGSHASTWENKNQIMRDVSRVSRAGMAVLAIFCAWLVWIRRFRLLFIIPPVLLSVVLAAAATVLAYGSIHGLVLSFGVGLVGIAYDYGSHSAFNSESKSVWAANWFGYLTTVAVFLVLAFSRIPLLRQMMFFSIVGLSVAFALLFLLHRYFPGYARSEPLQWVPKPAAWKMGVIVLLQLGVLFSWGIRTVFDMGGFDFQSPPQKRASSWLFQNVRTGIPLFEVHEVTEGSPLQILDSRLAWARERGIHAQNAARFLPNPSEQEAHLKTWKGPGCGRPDFFGKLSGAQSVFFAPYFHFLDCDELKPNPLDAGPFPSYVSDLNWGKKWITLWLPENAEEAALIASRFPQATSLKALTNVFPSTLVGELKWMGPLSFILVTFLLLFYFKDLKLTLIALIPFSSGLGLVAWYHFLSGAGFSFISLIALTMVYGMSVDFGIFAADIHRHESAKSVAGVWTALYMAAVATIAGFLPLDFSQHRVLIDLGMTSTLGMAGTVAGAIWGVPFALERLKKKIS